MDDALPVRGSEAVGDLAEEVERVGDRQRSPGQPLAQVLALHHLHDEETPDAVFVLEGMERGDVGVVQRGKQAGLAFEPGQTVWVAEGPRAAP